MISHETLSQFADTASPKVEKSESQPADFDMEEYVSRHGFEVIRRKLWQSNPVGVIFELNKCPFNPEHTAGSAAFTLRDGVPGFTCKHNGCHGNTIKDVFALYPADRSQSEAESGTSEQQRRTQAQILCELAAEANLFHTPDDEGYAQIPVQDHTETWAIRSTGFARWLRLLFYQSMAKPPSSQAMKDAINVLEARAQARGPKISVFIRVAAYSEAIYLDLCNDGWEAVEITPRGWRVVAKPPVRFRRTKGMLPLPDPQKNGSLNLLRNFINIGSDDNWILCCAWLIASCRPTGPYPILILQGEQGSAKSTMARLLRRLIDPSTAPIRSLARDERDLVIAGSNAWMIAYDNVSGVPVWLSDALCRIATGGGFSTRQLFTDADEVLFDAMRPILLNGIDQIAERPDLAERALLLRLPVIRKHERREEATLHAEFEQELPRIFGGLCDAMSVALAEYPNVTLLEKPRMADFARFATAAMPALGVPREKFVQAYDGNQAEAVQDTLEEDPVAIAIFALLDRSAHEDTARVWEGSCKDLLTDLEQFADEGTKRGREWPKSPRHLSSRLRRLVTFLRESGVEATFHARAAKGKRTLAITRTGGNSTATTATSATADSSAQPSQSDASGRSGGGVGDRVAEQSPPGEQPPPIASSVNPLKQRNNGSGEAVVTEVAVVCSPILDGNLNGAGRSRIDLCARCGPVNWEWLNGMWVCPHCEASAQRQQPNPGRERTEL